MLPDDRPLRVLYSFPHPLGSAGLGTTAWQQVNALGAAGHRVTVMTGRCVRPVRHDTVRLIQTVSLLGRRIPYRAIGVARGWAIHDWQVARHLARHARDYDLVHVWPSAAERTLRAAREVGVPSFLHRPNTHPAYACDVLAAVCRQLGLSTAGRNMDAAPARIAHEEREFALADWLLCPSAFVAQTFVDRGFPLGRIARQRYGYDPATFQVPPRRHDGPPTAAFVGTGEPRKGLHLALRAWLDSGAADAGGTLHVAGEVVPEYAALLSRELSHPSVRLHGFVPEVARVMAGADVLLLPTYEEGSAKVTYEARACGCVLMVSEAAGAVVRHGHNGLVHATGDQSELTRQFRQLLAEPTLLQRLRGASLAEVEDLTWARAVGDLAREYRRCLGETGVASRAGARVSFAAPAASRPLTAG